MRTIHRALSFTIFASLAGPVCPQQAPPTKPATEAELKSEQDRRSESYFNFSMAHYYEEQFDDSGRSEHANLAIEYYRKAYALDPRAAVIGERLAEMYFKSQRIRDAVLELQDILKREPDNISVRRLLGRIYVRTLGDRNAAGGNRDIVVRAIEQFREVYRLDPTDTDAAMWLARLYRLQGDSAKAEEVLRSVLQSDPNNVTVLRQLTESLLEHGASDQAIQLLEEASKRSPSTELFILLGDAAMHGRDFARAESAYRSAVERDPGEPKARSKLAQCLLAQDKYEAAIEHFVKLTQLDPDEPDNFLQLAQIYRQLRKLDLAEDNLLRARQLAPGNLDVLYNEAMLYEDQGRYEDSIRVLSSAVTAVKSNPARLADSKRTLVVLYEHLGRLYREAENFPAAISTFQEMLKFGPDEEKRARLLIAETLRESKDMTRALAECEKARGIFPGDRGVSFTCALLLGENGETDRAAATLRQFLRGDASDRDTYLALAQVFERGRRFDDAEKNVLLAERLSKSPDENEGVWLLLGAVYERQKKYDLAEAQFKRVLEVNPRNSQALNYYGYMLAERGERLEEATAFIERALAEEPNSGAYLDSLGWAYFQQNRLEEAEKYLRRAVERSSMDPTIREHLGDLYLRTGRPELAAKEWERSLAEWRRAIPAEREEERIAEVDKKLTGLKHRLAQKSAGEVKPQ